ncbi:MAG: hypothetical protein GXY83_17575 [Rhodopirellula sp.]|nr:hypothetical protein [Rhodopirellula sp.]
MSAGEKGFISVTGGKRVVTEQPAAASKAALRRRMTWCWQPGGGQWTCCRSSWHRVAAVSLFGGVEMNGKGSGRKSLPGSPAATIM